MTKRELDLLVEGTLLDRLIDREPDAPGDRPMTRADSIREYKLGLQRDLDWLLNGRQTDPPNPARFPELADSVYHFGLPDLTSLSRDSADSMAKLAAIVEQALATFEPRLTGMPRASVVMGAPPSSPFALTRPAAPPIFPRGLAGLPAPSCHFRQTRIAERTLPGQGRRRRQHDRCGALTSGAHSRPRDGPGRAGAPAGVGFAAQERRRRAAILTPGKQPSSRS